MATPLTLQHRTPPWKGDCIHGVEESLADGFIAQDVNGVCLEDLVFAAAHSGRLGRGSLDAPWTGLPVGILLEHITSAQWARLGGPAGGGSQRPALLRDVIAWSAGRDFTVCCDIKPGTGTHQVAPYADLKAAGVAQQAPFLVMTEQWSPSACKTRAAKDKWEDSAKIRMAAAHEVDVPTMLLWREHIPANSDWWLILDAVKGAPATQQLPAHVVRVPERSHADAARKVLALVTSTTDWTPSTPTPPEVPVETSQNGWPAATSEHRSSINVQPLSVRGVDIVGGVRGGDVATVLGYVLGQHHDRVEKLVNPGCWGYSYRPNRNNPNKLSNHSSATAVDANAPKHPNGIEASRNFTKAQIAEIHQILAEIPELADVVHWGGDWHAPGLTPDPMHYEIHDHNTARLARVAGRIRTPQEEDIVATKDELKQIIHDEVGRAPVTLLVGKDNKPKQVKLEDALRDTDQSLELAHRKLNALLAQAGIEVPK